VDVSRGHEESSRLKRFADKGIRSQVGPFSKETEHSCKGWVLLADCQAVNGCNSQLVLLPLIERCVVGCCSFPRSPGNFKGLYDTRHIGLPRLTGPTVICIKENQSPTQC